MPRIAAIASRAALAVLLACAFLRALVSLDPFPYWSGDPTLINTPMTALGPAGSLLLDTISLFAAAVILFAEPLLSRRILWLPFTLICLGAAGVIVHGWLIHGPDLDNIRIGAGWTAALFGALAVAHVARDGGAARLIAATTMGLIALLAAKGAVQVFIEHAETVDQYRQSKDMFLAAQGWAPGSAAALNFERRLDQPEAACWFGLANVTASFAAATLTALLGWAVLAWRETRAPDQRLPSGWPGLLSIGALAALATLILAGAKGGYTAAALGIALLAAAAFLSATARPALSRRAGVRRAAPILPLILIAAALSALVLRGLLGERLHELSLLFRWFYISTAARIFTLYPLLGIGPANFQDAYQLLKPAISPEEVTSPHSVLFDFTSTLGLFGAAFALTFLLWAARAGAALFTTLAPFQQHEPFGIASTDGLTRLRTGTQVPPNPKSASQNPKSSHSDLWFLLFTTATPTLLSAWIEAPIATPDSAIMRLLGLSGWIGIALAALALMRLTDAWRIPFAAAAIVLAVHGQIEVTPIWPGSVHLYFLIIAAAGASTALLKNDASQRRSILRFAPGALILVLAASLTISGTIPVWQWERYLAKAAAEFAHFADFHARRVRLEQSSGHFAGDSLDQLLRDVRADLREDNRSKPPSLDKDFYRLFWLARVTADGELRNDALGLFPSHLPTLLAASRLCLQQVPLGADGKHFHPGQDWLTRAEITALRATDAAPTSAASWGWLSTVHRVRYDLDHDRARLEAAIGAWTHAAALDPHGLSIPLRLMRAQAELGNADQARLWAARALQANADLRLDPLKQLSPTDLAEVRRFAAP